MDTPWTLLTVLIGLLVVPCVLGQTNTTTKALTTLPPATAATRTTTTTGPPVNAPGFVYTGYPFDPDVEFQHLTAVTVDVTKLGNYTLTFPGIQFSNLRMIILSCAADFAKHEFYFFDYNTRKMELLENFNTDMDISRMTRSDFQLAMAETWNQITVDWVNHNVYWTDGILGKIFIKKGGPNNNMRAVHVIQKGLSRPRGIAVDPIAGYIFWTDIQEDSIRRSSLVGANPITVAFKNGISVPDAIALDMDKQLVYWTDIMDINSISYDGITKRHVFRYSYALFYDILLFQNVLIATDIENYYTHYINATTGEELFSKKGSDRESHYGLCGYEQMPLPNNFDPDQCDKYGCSHICVKEPGNIEPTCLCWDGYKLGTDLKSCEANGFPYYRGIVLNTGTQLCMVDIQLTSDHKDAEPTCFYNAPANKTITHFDMDMTARVVYFSIENIIYSTMIDDISDQTVTITTQNHDITSMSYDWMNIMLYYAVDSGAGETQGIWRVDPNSRAVFPTRTQTGPSPRGIAVSPHENKVYWLTGTEDDYTQVEYSDLGMQSDNITLIKSEETFDHLTHMYHHVKSEYLYLLGSYWGGKEFYKMYYNGTAVSYPMDVDEEIVDFAVYQDYILLGFVEDNNIAIKSSDLRYAPPLDIINNGKITGMTSLVGIKVLDVELLQPAYPNPCKMYTSATDNGGCEHGCYPNSTDPSLPACYCFMGFTATNQTHCESNPVEQDFIVFSDKSYDALYQIDLNNPTEIIGLQTPKLSTPTGVLYNWDSKQIYTTNDDLGDIVAVYLNGTAIYKTDDDSYNYPDRFAYDPYSKLTFYTAYSLWASFFYDSLIGAVNEEGEHTIIYTGAHYPRGIVLHPAKGYLFYSDHGDFPGLFRIDMDGNDWTDLEIEGTVWPNGLGIDYTNDRLYFADGYHDHIKSCDLDGQNVIDILTDKGSHTMGLKFVGGYLYYSGWNNLKIKKVKVDDINDETEFGPEHSLGAVVDLDVYIKGTTDQIPMNRECSQMNGGCSHFCLASPSGHTCGCPQYSSLLSDDKTCDSVPRCSEETKTAVVPETDTCIRLGGQECEFECITNYKPKAGVSTITCTNEVSPEFEDKLLWNNDDPCEEIFCPMAINNGMLDISCDRRVDRDCINYTCNVGYERNPEITSLVCLVSGMWDVQGDLCIPKCPVMTSVTHHGVLHPTCTRDISQDCRFICDEGYRIATNFSRIDCKPGSQWNVSLGSVCEEILCKDYVIFGIVNETCSLKLGAVCEYNCESGYQGNTNLPTLKCIGNGIWDHGGAETDSLCTLIPPEAEKTSATVAVAVGIGAGVGVLLFLLIIVLFVLWRSGRIGSAKSPPVAITSFDNPRYAGDSETQPASGSQADKNFSYATLDEDKVEIVGNPHHENVYDNPLTNGRN